jgi:hypothetical protein
MLKNTLLAGLFISAAVVLYAGNKSTDKQEVKPTAIEKIECTAGCCNATASPTQAADANPLKRSARPENAMVYIISPKDGDVVSEKVTVRFGLKGMGVAPAGINMPNTGHHHLLLDLKTLPKMSMPIPGDKNHIHFGKGQTETELTLTPGTHTLQLLLGNYMHIPHAKELLSKKITITVK